MDQIWESSSKIAHIKYPHMAMFITDICPMLIKVFSFEVNINAAAMMCSMFQELCTRSVLCCVLFQIDSNRLINYYLSQFGLVEW